MLECEDCQNSYPVHFGHNQNEEIPSKCEICDSKLSIFGPLWASPLHNIEFVDQLLLSLAKSDLKTSKRIQGYLYGIKEEHEAIGEIINGYDLSMIGKEVKCDIMPLQKYFTLVKGYGYKIIQSFDKPNIIKTNAPRNVLYDIFKIYVQ